MFRPVKIRHYISAMGSRGFSAEKVLAGSGLDLDQLHGSDCLVGFEQCQKIVSNMIKLTGDQGIGFEIGRETRLSDLGIVGYAMMSSRNVREVTRLWVEYGNSLLGLILRFEFEEKRSDCWTLHVLETAPLGFIYNFCVEETLMMFMGAGASLVGEKPALKQLNFSFPAPAHEAQYHQNFDCPIQFNEAKTSFVFSAPDLDKPLHGDDAEFHEICILHCSRIMRRLDRSPTALRLRNMLLKNMRNLPDLDQAARELGMSARTLRRQLSSEGCNYRTVVSEFRLDLAREYLRSSSMGVKEIAYLLGYKDVNAFRRAFKAWTGQTVKAFRLDQSSNDTSSIKPI